MYYPYFRGKQFELLAIRETAKTLALSNFTPIIEPVKGSLADLERALKVLRENGGNAIVVVNPYHGDHSDDGAPISTMLADSYSGDKSVKAGILLTKGMATSEALASYEKHHKHAPTFIHAGFTEATALTKALGANLSGTTNVFFEAQNGTLYRDQFANSSRILLHDGFKRNNNADYIAREEFSDLHVTYSKQNFVGFGDFLIVGDDYSESGGPAYAVAIHLTFIDPDNKNTMYVYHFVSDTNGTPVNPAGKFAEALAKLITKLDSRESKLLETSAITEFRELHARGHYPNLGSAKKLSMKHHIETIAAYFS
jgi:hypothetical protein